MRVSLVGVSCVGTTTIGRILADRRGWPFFDLAEEIERHFGLSIERLQARFLTGYDYRKECAMVLERIATANPDCVIALPPSGLRDAFLRVVRRVPGVTVAVHDAPENILERITFPFRRLKTKKEPRRSRGRAAALEERIEEIMDRVRKAGDTRVGRVAALEEYLSLARAHEGATWFDAGSWSEDLADSYLALGRVDDAVRTIGDATRRGYAEGAELLCELAEKLVRSGHEPRARLLWQQARVGYPDDVLGLCAGWHRVRRHRRPRRSPGVADRRAGAGVAHR